MPLKSYSLMLRNTRTKLLSAFVAALALTALVFGGVAGAQRGAARQANTNSGGGNKRVVVRSGETARGSRMTVTADDSFKDYSAYRSGDRFYVVLPKSAAGGGVRGGSGKGYSDMQVQQRGDSVVLSFRVQPGAKPRVQQQFNRLEVVLDVPEGAGQQQQQAAASNEASRNQQPPAETRNQTPAGQQSSQPAATPPNTNPNSAAERAAAERAAERAAAERVAEAERAQAANNAAPVVTTPPVLTAEQPATTVDPNAQPGATPQEVATPSSVPAEQLAQAQAPASQAPVSITKPATAADPSGASLGAFLLRNWALTLIIALVVVGVGLVIAARRTPAATREPAGGTDAEDAVVADEPRATRAKEATAAALKQASATAEASIPAKASATAEAAVPVKAAVPTKASSPAETFIPAEVSVPAESPVPVETSTADAAEAEDVDVKPLAAATMLAGGAATAKSRKQSRKEARQEAKRKKKGAPADSPAVAEEPLTVAPAAQGLVAEEKEEQAAEETVVEETAIAEPVVEAPVVEAAGETAVEEFVVEETLVETPAVAETPVVEETSVEEFVAASSAVEESAVEETVIEEPVAAETAVAFEEVRPAEQVEEAALPVHTAKAPAFVEPSVEEVADISIAPEAVAVEQHEVAAPEARFDAAEEATVETEAAPASTEIVPAVSQASAPEVVEPEVAELEVAEPEVVEPEVSEPDDSKALAPVAEMEPAVAPEPERVQAATRALLEGSYYDRSIIATRDSFSRQMIAAELLAALAGRNPQRRERAGMAFVKEGYFDETARDLREADAPAERAAAARSLALLGERSATPHLITALEDQNLDVRRAAVEALGSLRDPVAVEPLEALLERERNERNRIPPRVIRVAADACREGVSDIIAASAPAVETPQEPAVETPQVAETAIEPAHVAEVWQPGVEVEPREEAATAEATTAEAGADFETEVTEAAEPAEVAAHAPIEESHVSIAPFVGEQEREPAPLAETFVEAQEEPANAVEPVFAQDARVDEERADEEEVTLVAEAPAHETGVDPFVADLTDELNAAAETQTFETAVVEPEAVAGTGIEPFVDTDEYAVEVSRPAAESTQVTLFNEDTAEELTLEVEPFRPAASAKPESTRPDVAAGEWFDFDMRELSEEPRAVVSEPTPEPTPAPPPAQEHVFEFSSGETFTPPVEPAVDLYGAAPEPPSFADARAELSREVEAFDAHAPEREVAAPVSSVEKGLALFDEHSSVPASIQQRLASQDASERAAAIIELSQVDTDEAFQQICAGFDDASKEVRGAAARALYELRADRAESFTRALREAGPERRRQIGTAISASGLAGESISQLTGESRERTYEAFSLLFLMAKAGEVAPLVRAIEGHPSNEVRLAVVKLLALSGQKEILPAFRRLAVRGSLPTEVRSAVMEAIYQISSSQPTHAA